MYKLNKRFTPLFLVQTLSASLFFSSPVHAEKASTTQSNTIQLLMKRIEKLERQVNRLQEENKANQAQNQTAPLSSELQQANATDTSAPQPEGNPTTKSNNLRKNSTALAALTPYSTEELEHNEDAALQSALLQQGGVLLPKGALEIEPSFTYANSSSDVVNIDGFTIQDVLNIGTIQSKRVQQTSLTSALSVRYGLLENLQVDLRVPIQYNSQIKYSETDNIETDTTRKGWGDIELGLSSQFWKQTAKHPAGLVQVQWKASNAKTNNGNPNVLSLGTGFNSLRFGTTFVKSIDPAAVFASLGYTWNIPGDMALSNGTTQNVKPGNTASLYLGTSLALSNALALSFGYEQRWITHTSIEGNKVAGSSLEVGTFKTGATFALAKNKSLDFSIGMGLTRDAPSYSLTVALPIRF